jgi:crotonobetainyl-CoA:carnitine CoA-transferase CaiB-like acyl-CoA transferase
VVRGGGDGQVVDAAIVDGTASLASTFFGLKAAGLWRMERGTNILDSGAPFYEVYQCKDDKWISVSAIESRFFQELLRRIGLEPQELGEQYDRAAWPRAKTILAERFRQRTQREWCELLEGSDACFAPVLSFEEAPLHHHMQARGTFVDVGGVVQPAPAPRFSRSVPSVPRAPAAHASQDFAEVLSRWMSR